MAVESKQSTEVTVRDEGILDLVERLQRFDGPAEMFLSHLLSLQCELVGARGGAILRVNERGAGDVVALYPSPEKQGGPSPVWLAQAAETLGDVFASGKTMVLPLHSTEELYGQAPKAYLVLVPLRGGGGVRGVAAFALDLPDQTQVKHAAERLELTTSLLSLYEMRLTLQRRNQDMRHLRQANEVLTLVNEQGRFKAASMALCNEAASRWGGDRVSLGCVKGRYIALQAMSHTENLSRKMQVVQDIEATMEECLDQDVEVLAPAHPEETYVSRAAQNLSTKHGPTMICSLPIRHVAKETSIGQPGLLSDKVSKSSTADGDAVPFAVLTVERPTDKPYTVQDIEGLRLTCDLVAPRLFELYYHDRWIGARAANEARRGLAALLGPSYTWVKLLGIAVALLLFVMIFVKGDYTVDANVQIEPANRRLVTARFEAKLAEVLVAPNDQVRKGMPLAKLDTTDYVDELAKLESEYEDYWAAEVRAREERKINEAEQARLEAAKIEPRMRQLRRWINEATMVAPMDGKVISTADQNRRLDSTVKTGETLFEIASMDELEAVLMVPESRIADVQVRQEGELTLRSDPDAPIAFTVTHIEPMAEVVGTENVFRVTAKLKGDTSRLLVNQEGVAKIMVDRRSLGYIWTRSAVNWLQMKIWTWF